MKFGRTESAGAGLLLAATVLALAWANSPASGAYEDLWSAHLDLGVADLDLRHWINDGLMALFFLLVGAEVRRELTVGELRDRRAAAVPIVAALAGMVVPALIYAAITAGGPGAGGWGIVMATDIAFVLGVLAFLGDRCPPGVRVFLLTLAVVDDIGAVAVIAIFYSGGIHLSVVGALIGLALPVAAVRPLDRVLGPWVALAIVPLFALANAGVQLGSDALSSAMGSAVTIAVVAGLVAGKAAGVTLASLASVRSGYGTLPEGMSPSHVGAAGTLAGIGFTVSLFVVELAFDDVALREQAKVGVLAASLIAAVAGWALFRRVGRRPA